MTTRNDEPARICGSSASSWRPTSNCRTALVSKNDPRDALPLSAPTFAVNVRPGRASIWTVAFCPCLRLSRSVSVTFARTSILPLSTMSAMLRPDDVVAGGVELAAAHGEARRQHVDLVLRRLHGGVSFHLHDLLLGLGEVRPRLLDGVDLVRRVEFDHDVVLLDRCSGGQELQDAQ